MFKSLRFITRRRGLTLALGALLAFLVAGAWTTHRMLRQHKLDAALWNAVEYRRLAEVVSLLQMGADPNINEYEIIERRNLTTIDSLLVRLHLRKERNWALREQWNTALWFATDREDPDIVRALIAKGAQDKATGYLDTALSWAAWRGHLDIVQSLLIRGSDPNAQDDYGETAMDGAVSSANVEIAKLLIPVSNESIRRKALASAKFYKVTAIAELLERSLPAKNETAPAIGTP